MNYRILPYKPASESAKALADSLGGLRLKTDVTKPYRAKDDDLIVNWGASKRAPRFEDVSMLNPPEVIHRVADKLEFFQMMQDGAPDLIPEFWTDKVGIPNSKFPIVCRTVLNGHSGKGIVIATKRSELVDAPLYVRYMRKDQEYRIHVGVVEGRKNPDKIIAMQRKARVRDIPDDEINWKVRNLDGGFIYARTNVAPPARVTDAARQALEVVGLDFGAVDVIDNERKEKAYVLEINSAPGLESRTVVDYVDFFKKQIGSNGIIPKASVTRNEDKTWHVVVPYLDEFKRRRYSIDDVATWDEALGLVKL